MTAGDVVMIVILFSLLLTYAFLLADAEEGNWEVVERLEGKR